MVIDVSNVPQANMRQKISLQLIGADNVSLVSFNQKKEQVVVRSASKVHSKQSEVKHNVNHALLVVIVMLSMHPMVVSPPVDQELTMMLKVKLLKNRVRHVQQEHTASKMVGTVVMYASTVPRGHTPIQLVKQIATAVDMAHIKILPVRPLVFHVVKIITQIKKVCLFVYHVDSERAVSIKASYALSVLLASI
jgi:hypothetical protein